MVNRKKATLLPLILIIGLFAFAGASNSAQAAPAVKQPAKAAATKAAKKPVTKPKPAVASIKEDKINLVYGDIVMANTREGMEEGEVEAVLFPHWFHRVRFRCKVCHEDTFKTEKGSNDVNMDHISAGEQCGMCHDGAVAWDPLECELCHMYPMEQLDADAAPPPEEKNPANLLFASRSGKMAGKGDRRKPSGNAFKWGGGWQPRAFSMAGLPKDKYGLVDWIKITKNGMLLPKGSIDPENPLYESPVHYTFDEDGEEDIEDIVIKVKSKTIAEVLFPHTLHAWWLNCKSCHPHRFVRTAGDTVMTMREMAKGKYCGECHGKVAFPLEDCGKCHNREKVAECKESENCTFD
ncbi:Cytochrome c family protein [hydrothermal vent metagenome]|uniref:Cytochrome c family protein n=1 Tax=hydrothermal vent metagenome TaxID=652676 RepID=A0A3B1B9D6_9ZZZZ